MNKKARSLALKIAQIFEENSELDIKRAVAILREYGHSGLLIEHLSSQHSSSTQKRNKPRQKSVSQTKPLEETNSRAVLRLRDTDAKKFGVMSEFDQLVRSGKFLTTNSALRRFGEKISKGFKPKKSKRESISAVMEVLSERSLDDINVLIESVVSVVDQNGGNEYQNLANFIIKGKS